MNLIRNAVPASLRKPVDGTRFPQRLMGTVQRIAVMGSSELRAGSSVKSRFAPMPQEPEDARMTGVTRSLNRRLLALNLPGSLLRNRLPA